MFLLLLGNGLTEGVPLFIVLLITLAHLLPPTAISFTGFNLGPKLRIPNPPATDNGPNIAPVNNVLT